MWLKRLIYLLIGNIKSNEISKKHNNNYFILHFNTSSIKNMNLDDLELSMNLNAFQLIDVNSTYNNTKLTNSGIEMDVIFKYFVCQFNFIQHKNTRRHAHCSYIYLTNNYYSISASTYDEFKNKSKINSTINLKKFIDFFKNHRQNFTTVMVGIKVTLNNDLNTIAKNKILVEQSILYAFSFDKIHILPRHEIVLSSAIHKRDISNVNSNLRTSINSKLCGLNKVKLNGTQIFNKQIYPEIINFYYCDSVCTYSKPIPDSIFMSHNTFIRLTILNQTKVACIATAYEPYYYLYKNQAGNYCYSVSSDLIASQCGCP